MVKRTAHDGYDIGSNPIRLIKKVNMDYILYKSKNYKNIIPYNLKYNKIYIHGHIIGKSKEILWSYYYIINGLKVDDKILSKEQNLDKIQITLTSNLNMLETKWYIEKTNYIYFKKYSLKRTLILQNIKNILILNNEYKEYNINLFYIKENIIKNLKINKKHILNIIKNKKKNIKIKKKIIKKNKNIID